MLCAKHLHTYTCCFVVINFYFKIIYTIIIIIIGKPRGIRTGRKLRVVRRENRWHDLDYKKRNMLSTLKGKLFFVFSLSIDICS